MKNITIYMDTEFNAFDGEFLSIGLSHECEANDFYGYIWPREESHPWVAANVIPLLGGHFFKKGIDCAVVEPEGNGTDVSLLTDRLAAHLSYWSVQAPVVIRADHPADIEHITRLMSWHCMAQKKVPQWLQGISYEIVPGASVDDAAWRHNALVDARALRRGDMARRQEGGAA